MFGDDEQAVGRACSGARARLGSGEHDNFESHRYTGSSNFTLDIFGGALKQVQSLICISCLVYYEIYSHLLKCAISSIRLSHAHRDPHQMSLSRLEISC